ncbi:hypothetical protein, partial [Cognatishimia sp.]|uniref:hypothetical protein n=1 Tax=Cognatishimia sp. TaxID=2211648 RepID=UPI0035119E34
MKALLELLPLGALGRVGHWATATQSLNPILLKFGRSRPGFKAFLEFSAHILREARVFGDRMAKNALALGCTQWAAAGAGCRRYCLIYKADR